MGKIRYLNNEKGSVLVLCVLLLAFLSILGISVTNTSTIEVQIAGNERHYKQNFYRAEGAMIEAQRIIDEADSDDLKPGTGSFTAWLKDGTVDMTNVTTMEANSIVATVDANARYSAVYKGIAGGGSLDITQPTQLYEYEVFGLYSQDNFGISQIAGGFRKRF